MNRNTTYLLISGGLAGFWSSIGAILKVLLDFPWFWVILLTFLVFIFIYFIFGLCSTSGYRNGR